MREVSAMILGGGRGRRLLPLTEERCKPAVPLGGKYRLVDVPISNCINSGIRRIFVLTQYRSESLNRHIAQSYSFDNFTDGFVDVLAAEQRIEGESWFEGNADAVRRNLQALDWSRQREAVIINGDILFRLDLRKALEQHRAREAGVTLVLSPTPPEKAEEFGIARLNGEGCVVDYIEKPQNSRLAALASSPEALARFGAADDCPPYLACVGIYIFNPAVLRAILADESVLDIGAHAIPKAVAETRVHGFIHNRYWRDLGTIPNYFQCNLELARENPPFSFYESEGPIYTRARFLPPCKIHGCSLRDSLISDGCLLVRADIQESVIGLRSVVRDGARVEQSILMGADEYDEYPILRGKRAEIPLGIGPNTIVRRAIIDKNARIGRDCRILNKDNKQSADGPHHAIRHGLVIIRKNAVIPDGTEI